MMQAAEKAGNDEIKILNIYFLEIGLQVIIASSEECSSERYLGVLRNVILGYFGILHNVIWEFFRTLFWSSLERHFGVLRNVILEFFRTLFGVLRNVIWKFFGTLFGSSSKQCPKSSSEHRCGGFFGILFWICPWSTILEVLKNVSSECYLECFFGTL